jgi:4-amino-4-deoxy-L-arabinose transferase-like glycosyltransferase
MKNMSGTPHTPAVLRLARSERWLWCAPIVVLVALWLPGVWQGGFRTDTHVYAALTCALGDGLWDGGWLGPRIGNAPYSNKPPMGFYLAYPWVELAGGAGNPAALIIAVRIASLISLAVATIATIGLWRTMVGLRIASVAGLVLVLTLEFFRYGRAFSLDAHLVMFMTLAMWAFVASRRAAERAGDGGVAMRSGTGRAGLLTVAAGVCVGLGLLVKPMVALLVPVIAVLWAAVALRGRGRVRAVIASGVVALMAVLIATPWHLWMMANVEGFTETYFFNQSLDRATGESFGKTPWYYYPTTLIRTYQPWLVVLLIGCAALVRTRRVDRLLSSCSERRPGGAAGPASAAWLAIIWVVVLLAVLTVFADKRGRYLVPVYPAAALLVAGALLHSMGRPFRRLTRLGTVYWPVAAALLGAVAIGLSAAGVVRVHEPPTPWKIDLARELERRGNADRTWVYPSASRHAANVYVFTGTPPRLIDEANGESPSPGDAVLIAREQGEYRGEELWRDRAAFAGEFDRFRLFVVGEETDR